MSLQVVGFREWPDRPVLVARREWSDSAALLVGGLKPRKVPLDLCACFPGISTLDLSLCRVAPCQLEALKEQCHVTSLVLAAYADSDRQALSRLSKLQQLKSLTLRQ